MQRVGESGNSMNRRRFVGGCALGALAASRPFAWAHPEGRLDQIGLQLYTVRDGLKQNCEETLATVAEIGYTEVEFAGYFGHSPRDIRKMLDRHGLAAPSAHISYDVLGDKWSELLEDCHTIGHKYIVCSWIDEKVRMQSDGWKRVAQTFNRAAASAQEASIQFAYHNYFYEFVPVDGRLAYDLLLAETDADLVKMEMDLCWITVAGQDPQKYFDRWPGRFQLVHVKDIHRIPPAPGPGQVDPNGVAQEMTTIGSGIIDWKRLLRLAEKTGVKFFFVENDSPKASMEFLRGSYKYLRDLRF